MRIDRVGGDYHIILAGLAQPSTLVVILFHLNTFEEPTALGVNNDSHLSLLPA
jgi:hypothetical protein